ncbi:AhpC/TSA family protein [Chitinophaga silvatica]|uniref:AhpC/TSA family protein n=1 Tax=Chitinophaga silvatica TaxID=2282649 RepID=A0A3E1Y6T8_9BACT|nr:TlpA disulfide reductase family protein [Chitinophaga silvatica]RFS20655.1 AhpC/TSA family protein [Chitinophaga silvatica]
MIKQPLILLTFTLLTGSAFAQKPYSLHGNIPGAKDGTKVYLSDTFESNKPIMRDSAVIKDERFLLNGKAPWGYSRQVMLVIDKNPGVPRDQKAVRFFMGDEQVSFTCLLDSLPGYYYGTGGSMDNVSITGAKDQDLYTQFKTSVNDLTSRNKELYQAYLQEYHIPAADGKFNTARGLELVKEMNQVDNELKEQKLAFIKANRSSIASAYLAFELISRAQSGMTTSEIDAIVALPSAKLSASSIVKELKKSAAKAKLIAKGVKYIDIPLTDRDGKTVKLSSLVKPGQYNMLEFWASWCGPCRAEIPHLRELSKTVDQKDFNIISISIDERKADWNKAMKEEQMEWPQLCDLKGWKGPVVQRYKVEGVPFSIVLDPKGRIVASEIRGAELDFVLKDLLGDKITAF